MAPAWIKQIVWSRVWRVCWRVLALLAWTALFVVAFYWNSPSTDPGIAKLPRGSGALVASDQHQLAPSWMFSTALAVSGLLLAAMFLSSHTDRFLRPEQAEQLCQSAPAGKQCTASNADPAVNCGWEHVGQMLRHADSMLHMRINYFLIAEGILLAAFSASWDRTEVPLLSRLVAILALVVTFSFWYAIARMDQALAFLKSVFVQLCPLYAFQGGLPTIPPIRQEGVRRISGFFWSSYFFLAFLVPVCVFYMWTVLLLFVSAEYAVLVRGISITLTGLWLLLVAGRSIYKWAFILPDATEDTGGLSQRTADNPG